MAVTLTSLMLNGTAASGTVTSGETTLEWSQPFWGNELPPPGELDVSITLHHDEDFAYSPHGVAAEISVAGYFGEELSDQYMDWSFHRVWYVIDWGDKGATYDAPGNALPEFRDRNTSIAKCSAHVYRKPGRYLVKVIAYDVTGKWGTAIAEVIVKADDFADDEIIVLAANGNFKGARYCAPANRVTTVSELNARVGTATDKKWLIYCKRDDSYDISTTAIGVWGKMLFRDWGSGNKPAFDNDTGIGVPAFNIYHTNASLKRSNIAVTGTWDPITELPSSTTDARYKTTGVFSAIEGGSFKVTDDQCEDVGAALGYDLNGAILFSNGYTRTNYQDFMLLGGAVWTAFLGCREHQPAGSAVGSMFRDEFRTSNSQYRYLRNNHNGIRTGGAKNFICEGSDFTQQQGWTLQGFVLNNAVFRNNTAGGTGCRAFYTRNKIEGTISCSHEANGLIPNTRILIRGNYIVADPTNDGVIGTSAPGLVVQDNVIVVPAAIRRRKLQRIIRFYPSEMRDPETNQIVRHADWDKGILEATGNTIVVLASESNLETGGEYAFKPIDFDLHPNATVQNNVVYMPNRTSPVTADGPLDDTSLGFEGRFLGVRVGYEKWYNYHVASADTAPNETLIVPYGPDRAGNTTSAADFVSPLKRNRIAFMDGAGSETVLSWFAELHGNCTFAFEADGIHIANTSGETWPSGSTRPITLTVDRGTALMDVETEWATPEGTMLTYAVTPASGAYGDATGWVSPFDLLGNPRRGSNHPDAAPGAPSRGALESA